MRWATIFIVALMANQETASADSDILLQAVSFAITGSDGSKVTTVDRARCVFRIGNTTYFLNNVYSDRIYQREWRNKLGETWLTVELHGKQKIIEQFEPPPTPTGSEELDRALVAQDPTYFQKKGQTTVSADAT